MLTAKSEQMLEGMAKLFSIQTRMRKLEILLLDHMRTCEAGGICSILKGRRCSLCEKTDQTLKEKE